MTDRNMNSSLVTETEKEVVKYYDLIHLNIDGGVYLTTAPFNITHASNTYIRDIGILGVDNIVENAAFEIEKLNVSLYSQDILGNASDPIVERVLNPTFDYIDKEVKIWRVYYENNVKKGVVELYFGYITSMGISTGLTMGQSSVTFETSSHWSNFNTTAGRYTNTQSQALEFSGDLGFEYAAQIQKQISWKASV